MITLGIDLSSKATNTFACRIEWQKDGSGSIAKPEPHCDDEKLHSFISKADSIGIDAPFGWPVPFSQAVADWTIQGWIGEESFQKSMRFRTTDIAVHGAVNFWPLSVSTDRIALPAMRAMALLQKVGVGDKSGKHGRFFEVYPAATLKKWGLPFNGYKSDGQRGAGAALARRGEIIAALSQIFTNTRIPDSYAESDHALDALVSSLTARAAALGRTVQPDLAEEECARREGWIHIPSFASPAECVTASGSGADGN